MNGLVGGALGALVGVGLLAAVASLRGVPLIRGGSRGTVQRLQRIERLWAWIAASVLAAFVLWAATGWPVAGMWAAFAVLTRPLLGAPTASAASEIDRVEAIATWAEQIRDTMSASAGLQQALVATARNGPAPIADELAAFARRAPRGELGAALEQLGADIDHPSADMVVAGLLAATELDAGRLIPLLSRLASSIRDEAQMRVRIEVGRARVRTSMKIVGVCVALTMALLIIAGRELLEGYREPVGQVWLLVVGAVVVAALWSSRKLGAIPQPERFIARRAAS
ncbi:MAG: type II secretion system F family protein [Actinomycetota bacterium]